MSEAHSAELASRNLLRMPAEWEEHEATWIAWPTHPTDWVGKLEPVVWTYAEIVRTLSRSEMVEILCQDEKQREEAARCVKLHHADMKRVRFHIQKTDRSWLRDSAPTAIFYKDKPTWIRWKFNAWAKYDDFHHDKGVPDLVSAKTKLKMIEAKRIDKDEPFVCEGGAIDVNGEGTLLVTEECFLTDEQVRNPGYSRKDYEKTFAQCLGIEKTIWIKGGVAGDDTHGHIDDVARFVGPRTVLLAYEDDVTEVNHEVSIENLRRLNHASDAQGRSLNVILLPMPKPLYFGEERLPASYANFYIANEVVLVPTFNDPKDRLALNIIAQLFPGRATIGISSVDLVVGQGTLHCLTQQQPKLVTP